MVSFQGSPWRPDLPHPRRPLLVGCLCLCLLALTTLSLCAQRGALVIQQNLAELVQEADTIVRGSVLSAQVEPHPELRNLHTVVVTLRVERVLKDQAEGTFTFRQYIWDVRDRYNAAGYRKGQRLLLLLIKPSQYGLSSPAGMDQGRFRLAPDQEGRLTAVNGAANHGLFRGVTPLLEEQGIRLPRRLTQTVAADAGGPLPLEDLEALISALARAKED